MTSPKEKFTLDAIVMPVIDAFPKWKRASHLVRVGYAFSASAAIRINRRNGERHVAAVASLQGATPALL